MTNIIFTFIVKHKFNIVELMFFNLFFPIVECYVIVKRDLKLQSDLSSFDLFFPKKFERSNISLNYLNQSKCKSK